MTYKILGLFFRNTLTADDKYSLVNRNNLVQPIQMQLSKKQIFLPMFSHFGNVLQILSILKTKDDPYSLCIFEIMECERRGWTNVQKVPFKKIL